VPALRQDDEDQQRMTDSNLKSLAEREEKRRQSIRDAARRRREGDAFIYVACVGGGNVKIGCTIDVANRLKTLMVDHAFDAPPRLLAAIKGSIREEKRIHKALRRFLRRKAHSWHSEVYPALVLDHPAMPAGLRVAP
jgi:hypothetical protein